YGEGSFRGQRTYAVGSIPRSVAVADLDGDGIPDLVTANEGDGKHPGNTVSVLRGNGDGSFRKQRAYDAGTYPGAVTVADVNGDGIPDLVVANFLNQPVSVLLGNGDGSFQKQRPVALKDDVSLLGVLDVNNDGRPDLLVTVRAEDSIRVL